MLKSMLAIALFGATLSGSALAQDFSPPDGYECHNEVAVTCKRIRGEARATATTGNGTFSVPAGYSCAQVLRPVCKKLRSASRSTAR